MLAGKRKKIRKKKGKRKKGRLREKLRPSLIITLSYNQINLENNILLGPMKHDGQSERW